MEIHKSLFPILEECHKNGISPNAVFTRIPELDESTGNFIYGHLQEDNTFHLMYFNPVDGLPKVLALVDLLSIKEITYIKHSVYTADQKGQIIFLGSATFETIGYPN